MSDADAIAVNGATTAPPLLGFLQPPSTASSLIPNVGAGHWYSPVVDTLRSNPIFSGGAGLALVGVAATLGRETMRSSLRFAQKHFIVSLEIPSKDRSYQWVLQWLAKQQAQQSQASLSKTRVQALVESLTRQQHMGVETSFSQSQSGVVTTRFDLIPSPGDHSLWWRGTLIHYHRAREKSVVDLQTGSPWETLTLRMFGRERQRALMLELLTEAKNAALKRQEGKTIIYTSSGIDWRQFGQPRVRRPLSSVILDRSIADTISNDFREFIQSQSWYLDRGIPYRRGYLLYGPPGNGKSSFIQALAGHLEYNICVLNLNERSLTDDKLSYLMSTIPPRSLLLLEDIDAAFNAQRQQNTNSVNVTFSGLLNALDGVASTEERVVFMTTNHYDRLDPALIRPGRCDVQQYIGHASAYQQRAMFERFYPTAPKELVDEFVGNMTDNSVSVAELQGFFLLYKGDPVSATMMSAHWQQLKQTIAAKPQQPSPSSSQSPQQQLQSGIEANRPPSQTFIISKEH